MKEEDNREGEKETTGRGITTKNIMTAVLGFGILWVLPARFLRGLLGNKLAQPETGIWGLRTQVYSGPCM